MIYNLVNLDDEFSGMAQKSVGFTGADLNTTNATVASTVDGGSALDQIQKIAFTVPDLMNTTWIVDMYNTHAWIAKDLFFVCLILSVIAWLLGQVGASRPENEAYLILMLKRSVIAFAMIWNGMPILMMLLLIEAGMCSAFGGSVSYIGLMVQGLTSPFGCVMVIAYTVGIYATGVFYLARFFLIFLSCIAWIYGWLLWIFDRTASMGAFILMMILVNIFLSTIMTGVFAVAASFTNARDGSILVTWGCDVIGLIVMAVALAVPFIALFYFLINPHTLVRRTTHIIATVI